MPTLTALILGAIQISTAVENYTSFKRVQTLANLNALVVKGAGQLADERDITAGFVASGKSNTAMQAQVNQAQAATNATLAEISSQAAAVTGDSGYRAQTVLDLSNGVLAGINDLTLIRQAALKTQYPPLAIIQTYDERLIGPFDTFSNDIAAGTGNASMQTNVTVLNALLRMEDDASLQRAYLYQALASPSPGPDVRRAHRAEPGRDPAAGRHQPVHRGRLGRPRRRRSTTPSAARRWTRRRARSRSRSP